MNDENKIILDLAVSLDGFIEGPEGEIDWCIMESDMNFNHFLNQIDAIIYGRKSYDMWGTFQPHIDDESYGDQYMWNNLHSKKKYVFTHQQFPDTFNTEFIQTSHIAEAVKHIKATHQNDIWLYGGSNIITSFIDNNLIDEYKLSVHPVVLGSGKPLFTNLNKRLNLSLLNTHIYKSGVVQLIYGKSK